MKTKIGSNGVSGTRLEGTSYLFADVADMMGQGMPTLGLGLHFPSEVDESTSAENASEVTHVPGLREVTLRNLDELLVIRDRFLTLGPANSCGADPPQSAGNGGPNPPDIMEQFEEIVGFRGRSGEPVGQR